MAIHKMSTDCVIDASPERVFAHATAVESWPDVVPAIDKVELLTPGPIQVGTRFRETRTMMGRPATEEMEFLVLDAPHQYVLGAESHGCRYRTTFALTPEGESTRLTMTFQSEPLTKTAKVMSFLMKPFMKKLLNLCAKDLEAIKAHVESGVP
jgi:carbon monoxide dehydrogenase subunit G